MSLSTAAAPRQLFCATEARHQDMTVARDACLGRFTMAGCPMQFGGDLPWQRLDVHPDREWWIEWSKGYFGLDLAYAYGRTRDPRFVRAWEALVEGWVRHVPPSFGPTDAIGRRLQNWIYAWNAFERAGAPLGFQADAVIEGMLAQADHLQAHLTPERNHRTLELYALFVVALAFDQRGDADARRTFAWAALQENLLADVRPDGVHREQSTHYHMVVLRSFVAARENARRFGLPIPAVYDARLSRAVEFAASLQRPDGTIPALSDSDSADYRDLLRLASGQLGRPDILWVASNGREGATPATTSCSFDDGGYHIQRSARTASADNGRPRHLVFDCGPIGDGGHGHYDMLSVDAWAGEPLVTDPGRYTYYEGPDTSDTRNWRRWFKGTAAHNTVCVDGLDQVPYQTGRPRGALPEARLVSRGATPLAEWLTGEAHSPCYDAVHRRSVVFVDDDYWIVIDDLRAGRTHDYDLRWHLPHAAEGHTVVHGRAVSAPAVTLVIPGPSPLLLEKGWVSPAYGVRHAAPVISARVTSASHARFVTVILPVGLSAEARLDTPALGPLTGTGAVELTVSHASAATQVIDHVALTTAGTVTLERRMA